MNRTINNILSTIALLASLYFAWDARGAITHDPYSCAYYFFFTFAIVIGSLISYKYSILCGILILICTTSFIVCAIGIGGSIFFARQIPGNLRAVPCNVPETVLMFALIPVFLIGSVLFGWLSWRVLKEIIGGIREAKEKPLVR